MSDSRAPSPRPLLPTPGGWQTETAQISGPACLGDSGRIRRPLTWVALVAIWFISTIRLGALNPERKPDSYSIHGWFIEHGLPSNKVRAVTQTRDGYLWLATAQGIARFDGNHFTVFTGATNPELRGGGFFAVLEAPDGTLWFGGDNGLFRWRQGHFDRFTTEQGLAHNFVRALTLTRDGAVVACTRDGFSIMRDGRITTPGGVWKQAEGVARSLLERADGTILLGTQFGLWRISGEQIEKLSGTADLQGAAFNSLFETPDGSVWIGYSGGVRRLLPNGGKEDYGRAQGLVDPRILALRANRDGTLWIVTYGNGFYRLTHGRIEPVTFPDQPGGISIQQFTEGREGALWLAAATGLFRVRDNMSSTIGPNEGLAYTSVYSVLEARDGAWWIGLWSGGVYRFDQKKAVPLAVPPSLGLDLVLALAEEPDGTLWIGASSGLYRHKDGVTTNLFQRAQAAAWLKQLAQQPATILPGIAHSHVNSVAPDGEGGLWVATDGALYHGRDGGFRVIASADGPPGDVFKSVLRARNGDIWVTAPPAGVARLHEGRWTNYLCGQAISAIAPRAVFEDSTGTIWVTTEGGGLNRFQDGHWRTFTAREGLADDFISGIAEDRRGNFWIAFPRGVMRVPRAEFADVDAGRQAALRVRVFDKSDGLPAAESNHMGSPNTWLTRDGRVLLATDGGVAVIEPDNLKTNVLVPPMHLERFAINGAAADLSRPVVVPPGSNEVEIHYTAVSLIAPEKVRFKIRLAPLDPDWIDNGGRREVRYDKLPPGDYTFRAIACNNDGIWNEDGIALAFTVRPFFYQTGWFTGLVVLLAVAAAAGTYRTQVRRAGRRMAELETLVEKRTHELRSAKEAAEAATRANHESIVALKQAQEETARERARFKFIFEALPVGVSWMQQGKLQTRIVNASHAQISGVPVAQSRQLELYRAATHPGDREIQDEWRRRLVAGEIDRYAIEKRYVHPDGRICWVALNVRFFPDPASGDMQELATIVDITERKETENALRESTEKFRQLADNLADAFWIRSSDMRELHYLSPAFERIWGRSVKSMYANPQQWTDFVFPDDRARVQAVFATLGEGARSLDTEYRIMRPDGEIRWVRVRVFQVRDEADKLIRHTGIVTDITARKETEVALKKAHQEVINTSRLAGMAEVATGVLHNVGNVLNSVNVSATLVADHIRHTKALNIVKVSALLEEHKADLAGFLTTDPRGQMIPAYLGTLAESLTAEHKAMLQELDHLRKNVEHIKDIVAMQQAYAKTSGVIETIAVLDMLEDALRINAGSLARHGVDTVRDYQARPVVTTDKYKVMQILINLVRNAKYACDESGRTDKLMTVRTTADNHGVKIAIIDNGIGIPAENLTRIFSHGFTTRKDGHGFGLHSGALAAREIGGSLTVQSDGPGLGAVFTLEIPYKKEPAP